jgi:hypothetical protein
VPAEPPGSTRPSRLPSWSASSLALSKGAGITASEPFNSRSCGYRGKITTKHQIPGMEMSPSATMSLQSATSRFSMAWVLFDVLRNRPQDDRLAVSMVGAVPRMIASALFLRSLEFVVVERSCLVFLHAAVSNNQSLGRLQVPT